MILTWLAGLRIRVLNVAGPREIGHPGIGDRAETALLRLFRRIAEGRADRG